MFRDIVYDSCSMGVGVEVEKTFDCGRPSASTFSSFSTSGSFTARTQIIMKLYKLRYN